MPTYVIYFNQGNTPGPFSIYLSGSSGETLYATGVTRPELEAGYLVNVPVGVPSSSVVVVNDAFGCTNESNLPFPSLTPTVTPTKTVTPTVTPTPSVTVTVTPTLTVTPSVTPTITPTRTITPTLTPSITPTPSIGASGTPTPTPTITRTPTITPTMSPTPIALTQYVGCGWGSTASNACNNAIYSPQDLYSTCGPGTFGAYCAVYIDSGGAFPLSNDGPLYVYINGGLWNFDSTFNWVSSFAFPQCS